MMKSLTKFLQRNLATPLTLVCSLTLGSLQAKATELSTGMTGSDVKRVGRSLVRGTVHRGWTAPAIEGKELGLDLGLEGAFVFRGDSLKVGNRDGVVPRIVPVPRVWLGADLPHSLQFSLSVSPGSLYDGVTELGGALQWAYLRELNWVFSFLTSYSYLNVFDDMQGNVFSGDAQFAKDFDGWQPYGIFGVEVPYVKASRRVLAPNIKSSWRSIPTYHLGVGVQLLLPAKISFQADLHGSRFSLGVLLAQRF